MRDDEGLGASEPKSSERNVYAAQRRDLVTGTPPVLNESLVCCQLAKRTPGGGGGRQNGNADRRGEAFPNIIRRQRSVPKTSKLPRPGTVWSAPWGNSVAEITKRIGIGMGLAAHFGGRKNGVNHE